MASTKYYLQSKKSSAPIYLRFSDGTKFNVKRKTGLLINPENWSKKTNYPIAKDKSTKDIKSKLMKLENYILDKYNEEYSNGKIIDGFWLEKKINQFFNRADYNNPFESVFRLIEYIIENAHTRKNGKGSIGLSHNRIKSYKNLRAILSKFNGNNDISIKSIDKEYINRFSDWLLNEEDYKISTANKKISDLKGICFEAESHGIQINPQIRHIKTLAEGKTQAIIILNRTELNQISKTKIENKGLQNIKKWLLFGCEIGQRIDDLLNITENDICKSASGDFRLLKLKQKKGGKIVEIPLNPIAEDIIKDGFPYKISTANFNKNVKTLCHICEINDEVKHIRIDPKLNRKKEGVYKKYELIAGHVCRRSFASNYYGLMSNSLIMKVTGHSAESTFLKYIGKSNEDFSELIYKEMLRVRS